MQQFIWTKYFSKSMIMLFELFLTYCWRNGIVKSKSNIFKTQNIWKIGLDLSTFCNDKSIPSLNYARRCAINQVRRWYSSVKRNAEINKQPNCLSGIWFRQMFAKIKISCIMITIRLEIIKERKKFHKKIKYKNPREADRISEIHKNNDFLPNWKILMSMQLNTVIISQIFHAIVHQLLRILTHHGIAQYYKYMFHYTDLHNIPRNTFYMDVQYRLQQKQWKAHLI